jgi:hypothetical protein
MDSRRTTWRHRQGIAWRSWSVLACATVAWLGSTPAANAQLLDNISSIDGEHSVSNAALAFFNRAHCESPGETLFELTIAGPGEPVIQVYLWMGIQNANCEQGANRTDLAGRCSEVSGNPHTVATGSVVRGLSLQDLIDTPEAIVDCGNTALQGVPYEIFVFRNEDPGSKDLAAESYGIAPFVVDVTPPDALETTSAPEQEGTVFTISWTTPTDASSMAQYNLYVSEVDVPEVAVAGGIVATASRNAKSISVSAVQLGLAEDEQSYLFVSAVDEAAITAGDGNEGPLSTPTKAVARANEDACADLDGGCPDGGIDAGVDAGDPPETGGGSGGCSASRAHAWQPAMTLLAVLLGLAWRRRTYCGACDP